MKSSNRWLLIFGTIIGVLAITAVTLVLTLKNNTTLLPENTPEGVVQRDILAIKDGNFQTAYDYFSETAQTDLSYANWKPTYPMNPDGPSWQATIGKATITGNTATVSVNIDRFYPGGVINNSTSSQTIVFQLVQESGNWKINLPVNFLWYFY